jgi:hypothetical protein
MMSRTAIGTDLFMKFRTRNNSEMERAVQKAMFKLPNQDYLDLSAQNVHKKQFQSKSNK